LRLYAGNHFSQALIMSDLPFAITEEAKAHIERVLLDAQKELKLLGMARVLGCAFSCRWSNPKGDGGWYPFEHVLVGWHQLEEVTGNSEYTELELVGFQVFVHKSDLERIRGKRIVLDRGKGMAAEDFLAVQGDDGKRARSVAADPRRCT
jgi:hypothetical protein